MVIEVRPKIEVEGLIQSTTPQITLPTTSQNNLKVSIEEAPIQVPVDIQGILVHKYSQAINVNATTSQSVTLDTEGLSKLGIYAKSSANTNFHLDVSNDNVVWINDYLTWNNTTSVNQVIDFTFRYARLRSDAAASGTVTLILMAKL